jgi:Zn-dependent protease with chaperone function
MWETLFLANVVHGVVALMWCAGARRLAAPRSPAASFALLSLCLVIPAVAAAAHLVGLDPLDLDAAVVRVERWLALIRAAPPLLALVGTLLVGTALVFALQELGPALAGLRARQGAPRAPDARLAGSVARMGAVFRAAGALAPRTPLPSTARLETDAPIAALTGLVRTEVVVSRGLLAVLDEEELDAVVAHELAHLARGGNRRMLVLWLVRTAQAHSPASLIMFRQLVEAQELACDELAARVTGAPAALASALLASRRARTAASSEGRGAVGAILRRADLALTRDRVTSLLHGERDRGLSGPAVAAGGLLLAGLLWAIA